MKRWLRAGGEVEFISDSGLYWRSGHWQDQPERRRSLMRELLTEQQAAEFEKQPGRFLLPGTPP